VERILDWVGRLRELAAAEDARIPAATLERLDQAVATGGERANKAYQAGRKRTADKVADFKNRMEAATDAADREKLNIERRRLVHYATFPFEQAIERVRAGMRR
jgi:hypothetical protein